MKKYKIIIFALFLILTGCNNNNPIKPEKTAAPVLSELSAPDTLFLSWDEPQKMTVKANDPQGIRDIEVVFCEVWPGGSHAPIKIDTLYDDGTDGDLIPGNGIYSKILDDMLTDGQLGTFALVFQAEDKNGELSNKLTHQIVVVKGIKNPPPIIHWISAPESIDVVLEQNYLVKCSVSDPKGYADITLVTCEIFLVTALKPFYSDTLVDDSTNGDEVASDSIYSFILSSNFSHGKVRRYYLRFRAYDSAGNESRLAEKILQTYNSVNEPPVISNLVAPDTMFVPMVDVVQALLTLDVRDPQGLSDVREVYFNSYKPDNSPASGNPFQLKDDGSITSGDKTANDGTYSLRINLSYKNTKGTYRFVFEAVDYSNVKSNQIIHYIFVR